MKSILVGKFIDLGTLRGEKITVIRDINGDFYIEPHHLYLFIDTYDLPDSVFRAYGISVLYPFLTMLGLRHAAIKYPEVGELLDWLYPRLLPHEITVRGVANRSLQIITRGLKRMSDFA